MIVLFYHHIKTLTAFEKVVEMKLKIITHSQGPQSALWSAPILHGTK